MSTKDTYVIKYIHSFAQSSSVCRAGPWRVANTVVHMYAAADSTISGYLEYLILYLCIYGQKI